MRLYLINPCNSLVSIINVKKSHWNRYRVWKPLSLMSIAGITPPEWETTIIDENLATPDYSSMPKPDLVGITAFTSQINRAYELAVQFKKMGIPVVMGGIHATMCLDEVMARVDSVVTGEAEGIWSKVLEDVKNGCLKPKYEGGLAEINHLPMARHDLLKNEYAFGSIQTTRGCPLNCSFCSVTAFNGAHYRMRSIEDVVEEFKLITEQRVLIVDDNLVGTNTKHITRAKELFQSMIDEKIKKDWVAQVTINFADDDELLTLASKAGCTGVFIGFESQTMEGLQELSKKFNNKKDRDFRASVRRIQKHGIMVLGSFIIGLDVDKAGIGKRIAKAASQYGVDCLNVLFLTPFPGTRLWDQMKGEDRIALNQFPEDWKYFTLTFPVARFKHLNMDEISNEMISCDRTFYSLSHIFSRVMNNIWSRRQPLITLISNFSFRRTVHLSIKAYEEFKTYMGSRYEEVK